jgi:tRNA-2-methylthio-N6-dimethylallyladenosine synthase
MSKKFYIETYGCQMNFADTEVVASILGQSGFEPTEEIHGADLILVNTCSIRDNAEQRIWGRLDLFHSIKRKRPSVVIGVLGCMAERLKEQLLESDKKVDLVVGPDAYRDLPALVNAAGEGHKGVNVLLSREETYADISPVRMDSNGVSAFISIMRGCNNMCAYCVVPYTRGAERSRDPHSIIDEAKDVFERGYREVTLLGQNVDSYSWCSGKPGDEEVTFAGLIEVVAQISPLLRVRFSTNHPKDLSDELLKVMSEYDNICRHIHLPVQSGSSSMLKRMNRKYTREWYLGRVKAIHQYMPEGAISTDIIAGFCGETDEEHQETLSLMKEADFDFAYMFKYSERPGTHAARHYKDDVAEEVKTARLNEIINLQNKLSAAGKKRDIGKTFEVLVEGEARKAISGRTMTGRTSDNKVVVFEADDIKPGDYVMVTIEKATSATLTGKLINKIKDKSHKTKV